jgi:hypothetical protein
VSGTGSGQNQDRGVRASGVRWVNNGVHGLSQISNSNIYGS